MASAETKTTKPAKKNMRAVPVGWAMSAIVAALLISFGTFISPLFIATKCYVFMGICFLAAFLVRYYGWYYKWASSPSAKMYKVDTISLLLVLALVVYTGGIKFSQYWIDGGAEPFFHDITVSYIAGLAVLILRWVVALLFSQDDTTFLSVIRSFRIWAFCYILVWILMGIMFIVFEGD